MGGATSMKVESSRAFATWRAGLRDRRAEGPIADRIERLKRGRHGDATFFDGIGEIRIGRGPRLTPPRLPTGDATSIVLLLGGDTSGQARDVRRAIAMFRE